MRVCFCRAGRARVYVVVSVGVCNSLSCIRVGCKSKGRGLSACLALNAPATLFFLPDRVLRALWKSEPCKLVLPHSEQCWSFPHWLKKREDWAEEEYNLVLSHLLSQWGPDPSLLNCLLERRKANRPPRPLKGLRVPFYVILIGPWLNSYLPLSGYHISWPGDAGSEVGSAEKYKGIPSHSLCAFY